MSEVEGIRWFFNNYPQENICIRTCLFQNCCMNCCFQEFECSHFFCTIYFAVCHSRKSCSRFQIVSPDICVYLFVDFERTEYIFIMICNYAFIIVPSCTVRKIVGLDIRYILSDSCVSQVVSDPVQPYSAESWPKTPIISFYSGCVQILKGLSVFIMICNHSFIIVSSHKIVGLNICLCINFQRS